MPMVRRMNQVSHILATRVFGADLLLLLSRL